jgi:perosamine synthetase
MSTWHFFKGRVALYAILKAIGVNPGSEVILPGFTCVVVPNAITYLGGKPVYVDIDPQTFNIDPGRIEEKVSGESRVLVAQHTFGIPAEMDRILEIAARHRLHVIEDACHSIGSRYKGKEVGFFGDAAFFSSQWSKSVTTGLGGWARVNNPQLAETFGDTYAEFSEPSAGLDLVLRLQCLLHAAVVTPSLFWFAQKTYRTLTSLGFGVGSSSGEELECRMPADYKMKMSGRQQKLLLRKLADIARVNAHRKRVTALYDKLLPEIGITPLRMPPEYDPVLLRYPVMVDDKNEILEAAKRNRIEIGDWFLSPVHPNLSGWEKVGYEQGMCPVAENVCAHLINLPTHEKIGEREVEKIMKFLGSVSKFISY